MHVRRCVVVVLNVVVVNSGVVVVVGTVVDVSASVVVVSATVVVVVGTVFVVSAGVVGIISITSSVDVSTSAVMTCKRSQCSNEHGFCPMPLYTRKPCYHRENRALPL